MTLYEDCRANFNMTVRMPPSFIHQDSILSLMEMLNFSMRMNTQLKKTR